VKPRALQNNARAALFALGDYYAWSARKAFTPAGNDPRTGRPWTGGNHSLGRQIGRAENSAAAVTVYRLAREYPSPLPA